VIADVCLLEKGEKMSKIKSNRAKGQLKNMRSRRKIFLIVGTLISLILTSGALAQWAGIISVTNRSSGGLTPPSLDPLEPKTEYIYANGKLIATEEPVTATPVAPGSLRATTTSDTSIHIAWSASSGATKYELQRSTNINSGFVPVNSNISQNTLFYDDPVTPNIAYIYRVRAFIESNPSPFSEMDIATAVAFTSDATITQGVTTIKAIHITQLRQAIDAMRIAVGLPAATWVDSPLVAQQVEIKKVHIDQLRLNLNGAGGQLSFPAPTYTDPTIIAHSTIVKADHIRDLRRLVKGYKTYLDQT
jgi:hypothetical protein